MNHPQVRYTLAGDGRSDAALIPIVDWTIRQYFAGTFASSFCCHSPRGGTSLKAALQRLLLEYPCDILIVHRDAEAHDPTDRYNEISANRPNGTVATIPIVPVRMTEAWLLISEAAIRIAAGNPRGTIHLSLPRPRRLDLVADPKATLFDLIRIASEETGRKLRTLNVHAARQRIADLIQDYQLLRQLPTFVQFERDLRALL